jgi:hypothetical protein
MSDQRLRNILSKFQTITLEEMDGVRLMDRVDTKFVFSYEQLLQILPSIESEYRILKVENNLLPEYQSIYFDSEDLFFYEEHHRKRLDRFKVRYRKYVDSDIVFLEVKHKKKGRTNKNRILVNELTTEMPDEHKKFIDNAGVPELDLKPILRNKFNRITLVSKSSVERLTLDVHLEFEADGKHEDMNEIVIAELKQEKASRNSVFWRTIKKHRIRPYRLSKYCIGMIKIKGKENVKYNRFKKKLLKLNKIRTNAA